MTRAQRTVWIDGARVALQPQALIGQGGEAEVYDLGDGRVVKWWKPADHPDFDGLPDAQAAAAQRLAERGSKLRALPGNLPPEVVVPSGFALASRGGAVTGYVMPKVAGEPLHSYGEPRWRRDHPIDGGELVAALLALHTAIDRLHAAGVVIGDCNDLNVLVELGARRDARRGASAGTAGREGTGPSPVSDGSRVHLIDVDSYQFAGYACPMFSERFVDPRLCNAQLAPIRPHDAASDWFAFAVMVFRTLFGVSPWGGVTRRCSGAARVAQRITVYAGDVTYPRAARPLAIVPPALTDEFRAIFERDQRGRFPRALLEQLRLRRCPACGDEHARTRCPSCQAQALQPPAIVHGRLRFHAIAASDAAPAAYAVTRTTPVALHGDALMRQTRLGLARIGSVLPGVTRAWVGGRMGVGFYRAGGYAAAFVFRPDRGVLDDRIALPPLRGQLVAAHATLSAAPADGRPDPDDRAWLWLTLANAGRISTTCIVIAADARVLAVTTLDDPPWLAGIAGACAAGPQLFVPTDDGVARIEVVHGVVAQTRTFAETAPLVGAGDRLALHPTGLDAIRRHDAIRMLLT